LIVKLIALRATVIGDGAQAHYNVAFGFRILGSNDAFSGVAICEPGGVVAACDIEGDGGSFAIERNGGGLGIRLARMQVEGMQEFNPDLALRTTV